jgi:RimJ/RimL family protein N-acetyltransferase
MSATKLTTARLELHPLDAERDSHALHAIRSDRRVWSTMGDSQPPAADVEATRMAENGGWGWTIRAAGGQRIIGSVSLFPGDEVSRSLTWYLRPDHWGDGLASEAVSAVVDHLLGMAGFARLDAWIDHTNRRSIDVARNAGMTEHGRMAYYSHVQARIVHNVVMARAAGDPEPALLGLRPQLVVRDVEHVTRLLVDGLGMHLDTRTPGTFPDEKRVAISGFAGAPAIAIRPASAGESISPAVIELDVGGKVDEHVARCTALGMRIAPPAKVHWYRCYEVDIGDGHRIRLRGSKHPGL